MEIKCKMCGSDIPDYYDINEDNYNDEECPFCGATESLEIIEEYNDIDSFLDDSEESIKMNESSIKLEDLDNYL